MKKYLLLALSTLALGSAVAQTNTTDKLAQDRKSIMDMCGCYKTEFRYAEVYSPDTAYKFHEREYTWSYEWVVPVENSDQKISLQHILVVNDSNVVKHWRQDWIYENTKAYLFNKEYSWNFTQWKSKDVKGQWTQKVYQVDDSPRYTGTGTWIHADGKHYWESVADSPLPRRELTAKRTDYNILVRGNRQEITSYGWNHRQDNNKVMRKDGDKLICNEIGYNTYTKVDEKNCAAAKREWDKTGPFWAVVREVWNEYEKGGQNMTLKILVGGEMLYERIFDLAEESPKMDKATMKQKVVAILDQHLTRTPAAGETGMN